MFSRRRVLRCVPAGISKDTINKSNRLQTDGINRVNVHSNLFAIGDAAAITTEDTPEGHPGVAPVALQQGKLLARNLEALIKGEDTVPFKYKDKGSLATIGRNKAVADIKGIHLYGFFAWILWGLAHIHSIAGFSSKGIIFFNWAINYFTRNSDNRLIIRPFNRQTKKISVGIE